MPGYQWYCEPCDRYFVNEAALDQHLENAAVHADDSDDSDSSDDSDEEYWECTRCKREFAHEEALESHLEHSSAHWRCSQCRFDGYDDKHLIRHCTSTKHMHHCNSCGYFWCALKEDATWKIHKNQTCRGCGACFGSDHDLRQHYRHTGCGKICNVCKQVFNPTNGDWNAHLANTCKPCGKCFATTRLFEDHMAKEHAPKVETNIPAQPLDKHITDLVNKLVEAKLQEVQSQRSEVTPKVKDALSNNVPGKILVENNTPTSQNTSQTSIKKSVPAASQSSSTSAKKSVPAADVPSKMLTEKNTLAHKSSLQTLLENTRPANHTSITKSIEKTGTSSNSVAKESITKDTLAPKDPSPTLTRNLVPASNDHSNILTEKADTTHVKVSPANRSSTRDDTSKTLTIHDTLSSESPGKVLVDDKTTNQGTNHTPVQMLKELPRPFATIPLNSIPLTGSNTGQQGSPNSTRTSGSEALLSTKSEIEQTVSRTLIDQPFRKDTTDTASQNGPLQSRSSSQVLVENISKNEQLNRLQRPVVQRIPPPNATMPWRSSSIVQPEAALQATLDSTNGVQSSLPGPYTIQRLLSLKPGNRKGGIQEQTDQLSSNSAAKLDTAPRSSDTTTAVVQETLAAVVSSAKPATISTQSASIGGGAMKTTQSVESSSIGDSSTKQDVLPLVKCLACRTTFRTNSTMVRHLEDGTCRSGTTSFRLYQKAANDHHWDYFIKSGYVEDLREGIDLTIKNRGKICPFFCRCGPEFPSLTKLFEHIEKGECRTPAVDGKLKAFMSTLKIAFL